MGTLSLEAVDFCKYFGFGGADARDLMAPALAEVPSSGSSEILEFLFSGDYIVSNQVDKPCMLKQETQPCMLKQEAQACPSDVLDMQMHGFDGDSAHLLFTSDPFSDYTCDTDTSDCETDLPTSIQPCLPVKQATAPAEISCSPSPCKKTSKALRTKQSEGSPREELDAWRASLCELPPVKERTIGKWYRDKQDRKRYWSGSKLLCEHRKPMSVCKVCGGGSLCAHGRVKYTCKTCDGSAVCEHDVVKYSCRRCLERKRKGANQ